MLRFFIAGLATVGGVVLLFFLSFGDVPGTLRNVEHLLYAPTRTPSTLVAAAPVAPRPVATVDAQNSPTQIPSTPQPRDTALQTEIQALQAKLKAADQAMAALHGKAEQQHKQLAELQQQHSVDQSQVAQLKQQQMTAAAQAQAAQQAAEQQLHQAQARQQAEQQARQQAEQQARQQQAEEQEKQQQQAEAQEKQQQQAEAQEKQQQQAAQQAEQRARQQQVKAQEKQQQHEAAELRKARELRREEAQSRATEQSADAQAHPQIAPAMPTSKPPYAHHQASHTVADRKLTQPATASGRAFGAGTPDSLSAVLARLHREYTARSRPQAMSPPSVPPRDVVARENPPPITPSRERLARAREAIVRGRLQDAQQLLEEAQLQLVFRPVSPAGQAAPPGSEAATDVAQALSMLGAGRGDAAVHYIDRAMAETGTAPQQASLMAPRY